jgi:hypothetical protein
MKHEEIGLPNALRRAATQQALAVDAATRPQDRGFFETSFWLDSHFDLLVRRN